MPSLDHQAYPKLIALNTIGAVQNYLSTVHDLLDWAPEPYRFGHELIAAIEIDHSAHWEISKLAHDVAVSVEHYGFSINNAVAEATKKLAQCVHDQVTDMRLYYCDMLMYRFRSWSNYQLILEKLPANVIDGDYCAEVVDDFTPSTVVDQVARSAEYNLQLEPIYELTDQQYEDIHARAYFQPHDSARKVHSANWGRRSAFRERV